MKSIRIVGVVAILAVITLSTIFTSGTHASQSEVEQGQHCVLYLEPVQEGEKSSKVTDMGCYDTLEESLSVATDGAAQVDATTSPEELTDEMVNSARASSVVIGIEYTDPNFSGNSLVMTAPQKCSGGGTYTLSSMDPGWDDVISSAKVMGGCTRATHYEDTNFQGYQFPCISNCSSMGPYMDNKTSSIIWDAGY